MSSTNRGSNFRDEHVSDYYVTPVAEVERFLKRIIELEPGFLDGRILDPAAGGDPKHPMSYPEALLRFGVDPDRISTMDVREDSLASVKGNYLKADVGGPPDLVITNPPFIRAQEFIEKALRDVRPGGWVAMLLRLNFFGSRRRFGFWKAHMPKYAFVHHERISFRDDGSSDSIEHMHAVWKVGESPDHVRLFVI